MLVSKRRRRKRCREGNAVVRVAYVRAYQCHMFLSPSRFLSVEGLVLRKSVGVESNRLSNLMLKLRSSPALPSLDYIRPRKLRNGRNVHCPLSTQNWLAHVRLYWYAFGTWESKLYSIGLKIDTVADTEGLIRNSKFCLFQSVPICTGIRKFTRPQDEAVQYRSTYLAQVSAFVDMTAHTFKSGKSISYAACYLGVLWWPDSDHGHAWPVRSLQVHYGHAISRAPFDIYSWLEWWLKTAIFRIFLLGIFRIAKCWHAERTLVCFAEKAVEISRLETISIPLSHTGKSVDYSMD